MDAISNPSGELLHKFRSNDAVRSGLDVFYCLLRRGLESSGGDDDTLRLQSWTDSQIHAISSLALAIVSSSRSLSVEQAEGSTQPKQRRIAKSSRKRDGSNQIGIGADEGKAS